MANLFKGTNINSYFKNKYQKYVALFASGGGNDVFSTMTIAKYLKQFNLNIRIYSMLGITPFHYVDRPSIFKKEEPLIQISNNFHRYLMLNPPKEIRNTEHIIPEVLDKFELNDVSVKLISSKYNLEYLTEVINQDLKSFCSDFDNLSCIVCDFGGDILCDGEPTTFSPELDSISLNIVSHLDKKITDKLVMLSWLGIDGELTPNVLEEKLKTLESKMIVSDIINPINPVYEQFKIIFEDKIKPLRTGNTIPNALNLFNDFEKNNNKMIEINLSKQIKIRDTVFKQNPKIVINRTACATSDKKVMINKLGIFITSIISCFKGMSGFVFSFSKGTSFIFQEK